MAKVDVVDTEAMLAEAAADRLTALVERAVHTFRSATICLTGGHTPERLYRLLADRACPWRGRIDWTLVHLFWGDERHVSPDHPDSNYGMAARALINQVPVPAGQVHRMRGELPDAHDAARAYESGLREGFARAGRQDQTFDVMLLGVGDDGHIASIFPGSPLISAPGGADPEMGSDPRVAAVWAPHLNAWRITLTPRALLDAGAIVLVVSGEKKGDAVHAALEAPTDIRRWPVHLLRDADDRVEWFLDGAAAIRLERA